YDLFFFSSRRRHTRSKRDWSSDVCSSDLEDFVVQADVSYHLMDSKVEHTISPDAKNPIAVLPDFDLEFSPEKEVVRTEEGKQEFDVDVNVTNYVDGSNEGQVEIEVHDNWSVEQKKTDVSF